MVALPWDKDLDVGVDFMDADHADAAALINAMAGAEGAERPPLLRHFIAHLREHFGREERLMESSGFFALSCHAGEHARMLQELAHVLEQVEAGASLNDYFRRELPDWLLHHRNTMDFVTAEFARKSGHRA